MRRITPFAKEVYRVVAKIPLGQVRSYKWVALKAGRPRAHRAVGTILKNNPYPLIIPCHRVIRSDSDLGGYVFGELKKRFLLEEERKINSWLVRKK
jgi:O-6-methylguanine DNA methyltransferase